MYGAPGLTSHFELFDAVNLAKRLRDVLCRGPLFGSLDLDYFDFVEAN